MENLIQITGLEPGSLLKPGVPEPVVSCDPPARVNPTLPNAFREPLEAPFSGAIGWISLGCPKNLVDSEGMLGGLAAAGYRVTSNIDDADAVVVNTCGFIDAAREESLGVLRESLGTNARGERRRVIAVGCLAQRMGSEMFSAVSGLDAVVGMGRQDELPEVLTRVLEGNPGSAGQLRVFSPTHYFPRPEARVRLTQPWTSYVKISDGCDNPCTFCSIPLMRGKMRSRSIDDVEAEVRFLAAQRVQEIILIAQDSTHYGDDRRGPGNEEADIAALLRRLARVDGPRWIRLMYAYPTRVNDRLIEVLAEEDRICKYIDMPLQHASDPVLLAMKRPGTADSYLRLIQRLRNACPDITLRTTMILGFPGETDDDFERLLSFVDTAQFDRLGAFRYSPEAGTPAASLDAVVPAAVVEERYDRLMLLQQHISLERGRRWIGQSMPVLLEGRRSDGALVCRSERDAPDIDGRVFVKGPGSRKDVTPGSFLDVTITSAEPYDLVARAHFS